MANGIKGVDHVLVGVRDLDFSRATFERLGFRTTPRGRHVQWSTANYCVMFENDYLELIGLVDASKPSHGLDTFLERGEGLLGLALASRDADTTLAAWRKAGGEVRLNDAEAGS